MCSTLLKLEPVPTQAGKTECLDISDADSMQIKSLLNSLLTMVEKGQTEMQEDVKEKVAQSKGDYKSPEESSHLPPQCIELIETNDVSQCQEDISQKDNIETLNNGEEQANGEEFQSDEMSSTVEQTETMEVDVADSSHVWEQSFVRPEASFASDLMLRNYRKRLRQRRENSDYVTPEPTFPVASSKYGRRTKRLGNPTASAIDPIAGGSWEDPHDSDSSSHESIEVEELIYTGDITQLPVKTLRKLVKHLRHDTRNFKRPAAFVEKICEFEFACFESRTAFDNYSKYEARDIAERTLINKTKPPPKLIHHKAHLPKATTIQPVIEESILPRISRRRTGQAIVPFKEQFTYSMDFLDDESFGRPQYDEDFPDDFDDEMEDTSNRPSMSTERNYSRNFKRGKMTQHWNNKRPREDQSSSPPRRIRTVYPHANATEASTSSVSQTMSPSQSQPIVIDDDDLNMDESSSSSVQTDGRPQNVRIFSDEYHMILGELDSEEGREVTAERLTKICQKLQMKCRGRQLPARANRLRKHIVQHIDSSEMMLEVERCIKEPVLRQQMQQQYRLQQLQQKQGSTVVRPMNRPPVGAQQRVSLPVSQRNPPEMHSGRKLLHPQQQPAPVAGTPPAAVPTTATVQTRPAPIMMATPRKTPIVLKRSAVQSITATTTTTATVTNSAGNTIAVPILNGGNIRLAPNTVGRPVVVRNLAGQTESGNGAGAKTIYLIKSPGVAGKPATYIPVSNVGMPSMQSARIVLHPSKTQQVQGGQITRVINQVPSSTGKPTGTVPQMVAVNGTGIGNNAVKLVLNTGGSGITTLQNLQRGGSIRIGPSPLIGQKVLISGNSVVAASSSGGLPKTLTLTSGKGTITNTNLILRGTIASSLATTTAITYSTSSLANGNVPQQLKPTVIRSAASVNGPAMVSTSSCLTSPNNSDSISSQSGTSSSSNNLNNHSQSQLSGSPSQYQQEAATKDGLSAENDIPMNDLPVSPTSSNPCMQPSSHLPNQKPCLESDKDLVKILVFLIQQLCPDVPTSRIRPLSQKVLAQRVPRLLDMQYHKICSALLKNMSEEFANSKTLLEQLRTELRKQEQLLHRFNHLKADLNSENAENGEAPASSLDLPSFELVKPLRSAWFTSRRQTEKTFRKSIQRILRKELYTLMTPKRRRATLRNILNFEKMCYRLLARLQQATVVDEQLLSPPQLPPQEGSLEAPIDLDDDSGDDLSIVAEEPNSRPSLS